MIHLTRLGFIAGLVAVLAPCAAVSPAPAAQPDDPVTVEVLESTAERIAIRYGFSGFDQGTVRIADRPYAVIRLSGEALTTEVGAPALPVVARSVIIPDDARMELRVLDARFYELHGIDVAPSKGPIPRSIDPADVPYTFGEAYARDEFSPGPCAMIGVPYIMRDHRGLVVRVHPFQHNPVARVLRVYTELTVELVPAGPGEVNVLRRPGRERSLSRAFDELYSAQFINYGTAARYEPLDETGDMLIICHDPWLPHAETLAAHKASIGIDTAVVGVSSIGNDHVAIKAYIEQVYATSDLAFVLLVGDGEHVACPYAGGASDPTYALLAGDDPYPEIMVGRFSAQVAGDVVTQVDRTIEYEWIPATEQPWFWRGTGIGSAEGPGDDSEMDWEHIDNIRELLMLNGYTEVDQIYDPGATSGQVTAALNDGRGIVNYCGHGGITGWSTSGFNVSHVNSLANDSMLPFVISVACVVGDFDGPTCLGEAFMRATNGTAPTGAIGFYGSSINQYWNEPMEAQDTFNDLLVAGAYSSYGTLCYAASCSMMDAYGQSGVDMFLTWHVFGDPSVCVVGTVVAPSGLGVTPFAGLAGEGPHGGPFEPSSLTYTLHNHDENPIDYVVTTDAPWIEVDWTGGTILPDDDIEVTVSIGPAAQFLAIGHYEGVVSFTNLSGTGGDTERLVTLDVGVPVPIYVFDMDAAPGWSMSGEWAHGLPSGEGGGQYGYPDPPGGATGENVCGVNINGDYSTSPGGPWYLSTGPIDCGNLTQVSLRFMRWLNTDYQPYVWATVEVSNDGTGWTTVWENGASEIAEDAWSQQLYDISAIADQQPTVYARWGYAVAAGAWPYSGWNIDDVEILGVEPGGAECAADTDGNGVVEIVDLLAVMAAWGQAGGPEDIDGDGTVGVGDLLAVLAQWGPCT
jgi:hypothetical protein